MLKFHPKKAHITSWTPNNSSEVFYLSPIASVDLETPIRGGVPICWPWFGIKEGEKIHGFARVNPWTMILKTKIDKSTKYSFKLNEKVISENKWPNCELSFEVIVGKSLEMNLITKNLSNTSFQLTQALHSYFRIGRIQDIAVKGLENKSFYNKVSDQFSLQYGYLNFHAETDNIYISDKSCTLLDPILKRKIHISKKGSNSTVIWNPWKENSREIADMPDEDYQKMVCIEAANTHLDPVVLNPGETHLLSQKIEVLPF